MTTIRLKINIVCVSVFIHNVCRYLAFAGALNLVMPGEQETGERNWPSVVSGGRSDLRSVWRGKAVVSFLLYSQIIIPQTTGHSLSTRAAIEAFFNGFKSLFSTFKSVIEIATMVISIVLMFSSMLRRYLV